MAPFTSLTLVALNFFLTCCRAQYNNDPPSPLSHACGDIIYNSTNYDQSWFYASNVTDCLTSVPFNAAVGSRFVKYFNQTLQFQSTSAFLRNPPAGYQQPPFDIFAGLQTIQDRIDSGYYRNQYAFEVDIQRVALYTHDAHTMLDSGILSQFSFSIPYWLVSASQDGKSLPEVYIYNRDFPKDKGSALDTINNLPVVQWLTEYAANQSFGMLEQNADWNQLMVSPSQLIIGSNNPLSGGGAFYSGDSLEVKFKDGHSKTWPWLAYYNSPGWTGPLTTGGDFYNFFVLGLPPANYEETFEEWQKAHPLFNTTDDDNIDFTTEDDSCGHTTSWYDISVAYPAETMMHEECLGLYTSGSLTGYFLEDISTAVLSIPTLRGVDETYTQALTYFIRNATAVSASKVIIDLQSCAGGEIDLMFSIFSEFFPNDSPFAGSRLRDHPLADAFGNALNPLFDRHEANSNDDTEKGNPLFGNEWVVTNRIDSQTGRNFTSWRDFYGPVSSNGDLFSKVEQYDLANPDSILDFSYQECHQNGSCTTQWAAEDIIILTDGTCSSACAIFVEMMVQAGVRTVAVGGRPINGPMQAAAGSRGARVYTSDDLDSDAETSKAAQYDFDTGMYVSYLGITLRDQIQENSTIPTQFLYQPANCRIFWTLDSVNNYTRLWHDAYNAIWDDTSVCVAGSVNANAPSSHARPATLTGTTAEFIAHGLSQHVEQEPLAAGRAVEFGYCDKDTGNGPVKNQAACGGRGWCVSVKFECDNPSVSRYVCIQSCTVKSNSDTCPGYCQPVAPQNGRANAVGGAMEAVDKVPVQAGRCEPKPSNPKLRCSRYMGSKVPLI